MTSSEAPSGPMRVAVLSSAGGGGGGIAARRMTDALNSTGVASATILTADELGGFLPSRVAPMKTMGNGKTTDTHFTVEYPGYCRDWLVAYLSSYDIVNVHWASYLLSLGELDTLSRQGVRVLFTLHDFHYLTGGCHYPAKCSGMVRGCFGCPQVDEAECDSSFIPINLRLKQDIFSRENVHLCAPSHFLRDKAVTSGIVPPHRAHVLRNPYEPRPHAPPRKTTGPCKILLIADSLGERRKGMALALDSLEVVQRAIDAQITAQGDTRGDTMPIKVDIVGKIDTPLCKRLETSIFPYKLHGKITDHARLVDIFVDCHLVLSCSSEDNWPNILVESGAYGCVPVVGPGHGCEEFVITYGLGGVASDYSAESFAQTLQYQMQAGAGRAPQPAHLQILQDHSTEYVAKNFMQIAAQIGLDREGSENHE